MNSIYLETTTLLLPPAAYVSGSIPWGVIWSRVFGSADITRTGSRNIGATNVRRIAGTLPAILTLIGDVLKGLIPVWIAVVIAGSDTALSRFYISITALSAFFGHLYPIFLGFKTGGKGVAIAGGCFLAIDPSTVLIAILVFILIVCITSHASAGSLAGTAILPWCIWNRTYSPLLTGCAILIAVLIWIRHKDNIQRIFNGTEPKI